MLTYSILLLALFASSQGRAVNISNTWVLPEEGFPVFYRYFRDRISWYEADAVCQFHHANLVTVDTTAQYDAVRAYLKELDISSAVWVGLIRSNPDGDFTWTDYRGLSGDGYWSSAPDARAAPLCAAADPAADYRWEARACGGPTVASFICELPVPQWALGNEGCLVRALPALTILYLPESAAVQLTADCGLAGVKRVQCTGNVKREALLKDLSCNEVDELTSTSSIATEGSSTSNPDLESNATELENTSELTTEDYITVKYESIVSSLATTQATPAPIVIKEKLPSKQQLIVNKLNNIYAMKNINLDLLHNNNLQSNDIPKLANNENFLTVEQTDKLEDEKHLHHKMLHDELAKHGNFETIFSQPTDHFIPPLVMAKSKESDDMTVLSLAEKHAQQLAEQQKYTKHDKLYEHSDLKIAHKNVLSTEEPGKVKIIDIPLVMTLQPKNIKDTDIKDPTKSVMPKKYKSKYDDPKSKNSKIDGKLLKFEKSADASLITTDVTTKLTDTAPTQITETRKTTLEDNALELTVIVREPNTTNLKQFDDIANIKNVATSPENINTEKNLTVSLVTETNINKDIVTEPVTTNRIVTTNENASVREIPTTRNEELTTKNEFTTTEKPTTDFPIKTETIMQAVAMNHGVLKITIVNDSDKESPTHTVFEITSLAPEFKDAVNHDNKPAVSTVAQAATTYDYVISSSTITTTDNPVQPTSETTVNLVTYKIKTEPTLPEVSVVNTASPPTSTTDVTSVTTHKNEKLDPVSLSNTPVPQTTGKKNIVVENVTDMYEIESGKNLTDPDAIDYENSPLLSGANEPLHKPSRSRRPQPPRNRVAKFNPIRILG